MADGLKTLYPLPNRDDGRSTTSVGEVRRVRAPSVFLELGYHDNADDAAWIKNNLEAVARNIVLSLTEYFGVPFLEPRPSRPAVVDVSWGYLNIRDKPDTSSPVLARAYDGARLTVLNSGKTGMWCALTAWWVGPTRISSPCSEVLPCSST